MGVPKALFFAFLLALLLIKSINADNSTYDYIVIGSGPGGGILASNIAKAGESVLLLEAGDNQGENPHEKVAGLFPLVSILLRAPHLPQIKYH